MSTHKPTGGLSAREEWRRGWLAVLVGLIGLGFGVTHVFALGLFAAPLRASLGWTTSEVYSGLSIGVVAGVIALPFVGTVVDHWGVRRVGLVAIPVLGLSIAALSLATSSLWLWWANWLVLSVAATFSGASLWATEVSRLFDRARGAALAVTFSGSSITQIVIPPLCLMLIDKFGWRSAYAILGFGGSAILLALVLLLDKPQEGTVPGGRFSFSSVGWNHCRDIKLVMLALCALLAMGTLGAVLNLFIPLLIFGGLSREIAAASFGMVGVGSLIGGLISGALLDRFNPRLIGSVFFVIPALPFLYILSLGSAHISTVPLLPFGAAILFGTSLGAELNVFGILTGQYFDLRNYGLLFSVVVATITFGIGFGSFLLAKAFDITGSYDFGLACAVPALLVSPLLLSLLGTPEFRNTAAA